MRLTRLIPFATILVVGVAACDDAKDKAAGPTAVEPAQSLSQQDATPDVAALINQNIASVCKSYRKAGIQLKKELSKSPNDVELQEQSKALAAMTKDACN